MKHKIMPINTAIKIFSSIDTTNTESKKECKETVSVKETTDDVVIQNLLMNAVAMEQLLQ